jgi:hypothetical protein
MQFNVVLADRFPSHLPTSLFSVGFLIVREELRHPIRTRGAWPGSIVAATAAASHPTNKAQFMFGNEKAPQNTGPGAEHKSLRKGTYGALSTE